jgi:integrase
MTTHIAHGVKYSITRRGTGYGVRGRRADGSQFERRTIPGAATESQVHRWMKGPEGNALLSPRQAEARPAKAPPPAPLVYADPGAYPFGRAIADFAMAGGKKRTQPLDLERPQDHTPYERMEIRRLVRLQRALGDRPVQDITTHALRELANATWPRRTSNATPQRDIITPALAVLKYYGRNRRWTPGEIDSYELRDPGFTTVSPAQQIALLAACEDRTQRLFVQWVHATAMRVSESLKVRWAEGIDDLGIDLDRGVVRCRTKGDEPRVFALADELVAALRAVPTDEAGRRRGRLFPYGERYNVYRWIRRISRRHNLGRWRPHMARHTLLTELDAAGVNLTTMMAIAGHAQPATTARYTHTAVETTRAALAAVSRAKLALVSDAERDRAASA